LQGVLTAPAVPAALLRARLALQAAENGVVLSGRPERAAALRDAVHLLRPGDDPGPAGRIFQRWTSAVARPLSLAHLRSVVTPDQAELAALAWQGGRGAGDPLAQASGVLAAVSAAAPADEALALMLADAALARALGWSHVVPLLGTTAGLRDVRQEGPALDNIVLDRVKAAAVAAVTQARQLARRAAAVEAVAPKLRAKGAAAAVTLFLSRDAVSPSVTLAPVMPDRAARRLCDRLVALGVVQELTGRSSFRLYGV
jgi:hypothetical protein